MRFVADADEVAAAASAAARTAIYGLTGGVFVPGHAGASEKKGR
jgi:hypothetical protein